MDRVRGYIANSPRLPAPADRGIKCVTREAHLCLKKQLCPWPGSVDFDP